MRVMGLDISATAPGIAVLGLAEHHGTPTSLFEQEYHSKKTGLDRALEIADWVNSEVERWSPSSIGIEGYGFGNTHTLVTLVEVGTVVRMVLKMRGHSWIEVPPNSLKQFVTGRGNAEKALVMKELLKRWQLDANTNNTADAMGAAMVALGMSGEIVLTPVQQKVLKKLSSCN